MRGAARRAALLLLSGAALLASGCGRGEPSSPAALRLERADLAAVCRALSRAEPAVARELAATRIVWPLVVDGLPAKPGGLTGAVDAARQAAAGIGLPLLFQERTAALITGPASPLAGLFRSYATLATRGWTQIGAAIRAIEHGTPIAVTFARANVNLYIESVYDAHFTVAQIGKKLAASYKDLGGAPAFAATLTPTEVASLAATYSEAVDRLHPHVGARLGS